MSAGQEDVAAPTLAVVEPPESPETPLPSGDSGSVKEIDRLDPVNMPLKLSSGTEVNVVSLKTRQFFRLLRIVTKGGTNVLGAIDLSGEQTAEVFTNQLLAVVLFSVPNAEQEAIEFIQSMVQPVGLVGNEKVDDPKWQVLLDELDNPELEDTLIIIEAIVRKEAPDLKALGKRLRGMMNLAEKTGQIPKG